MAQPSDPRPPRVPVDRIDVRVCRLATDGGLHSDGTAEWDAITMVIVEPRAAGVTGLGYSYIDAAAAGVVESLLAPAVVGCDALALPAAMAAMLRGEEAARHAG